MAHDRTHFGGLAGQVLRDLPRGKTLLTGLTLASTLFLTARGLAGIDQLVWLPAAALLLVCLTMAFHAVRAAADGGFEARGGLLRTADVGLRTAVGSVLWLGPWMLSGATQGDPSPVWQAVGMPGAAAAAVYLFATLIATPALLISATHSRDPFDVVSPTHWGRQFAGRGSDLTTIYTIQTGTLALVTGVTLPLVTATLRYDAGIGLAVAAASISVVAGAWTTVAGRLCGTIHASPPAEERAEPEKASRFDEGMVFAGPALATDLDRDMPERFEVPAAPEEAPVVPEPQPAAVPPAKEATPRATRTRRYAAPTRPVEFEVPKVDRNDRRTPLLDGEARVEEAMRRFRLDPSHTLSKLAELNQKFAPNPHVLQALTICLHRTGHPEKAFKAARVAFPLCFEQGHVSLAAAMFYELRSNLHKIDLKKDQVFAVAEVLHKADELAAAAKAYSLVVHADPQDFGAIKGLLDVADRIQREKQKPAAALKVYMFLLENCADPAMTEVVRDAMERCRDAEENAQPV